MQVTINGREYAKEDLESAIALCRSINGREFATLAGWHEILNAERNAVETNQMLIEEALESRFQSLAWNLKVRPEDLYQDAQDYHLDQIA